jgi:hypothetical protein
MADTDTQDAPESAAKADLDDAAAAPAEDAVEAPAAAAKDAGAGENIQPAKPEILADDEDAPDSLMAEFLLFLKEEKKWWLAPLVIVLLLLSAVIIFAEGSAIAPFIYTIF